MKRLLNLALVLITLATLLAGCKAQSEKTIVSTQQTGVLEIYVSGDPPAPTFERAMVSIENVEIHKLNGQWNKLQVNPPAFDLKAIQGIEQLLMSQAIEVGQYTQIRFDVKSVNIETGSQQIAAVLPAGKTQLMGQFDVVNGKTTLVTIDFNASRAINLTGQNNYVFKPVAHLITPVQSGALNVASSGLDNGEVGIAYEGRLHATGGKQPYIWNNILGALPTGLALDSNNGLISGIPTEAGSYSTVFQVKDNSFPPTYTSGNFTIRILAKNSALVIVTANLPDGKQGEPYATVIDAKFSTNPYTWQLSSGTLPPGLQLDPASGTIDGTPSQSGDYTFTIKVSNAASADMDSQQFKLIIK